MNTRVDGHTRRWGPYGVNIHKIGKSLFRIFPKIILRPIIFGQVRKISPRPKIIGFVMLWARPLELTKCGFSEFEPPTFQTPPLQNPTLQIGYPYPNVHDVPQNGPCLPLAAITSITTVTTASTGHCHNTCRMSHHDN